MRVDVSACARSPYPFDGRRLFTVIGLSIVAAPTSTSVIDNDHDVTCTRATCIEV